MCTENDMNFLLSLICSCVYARPDGTDVNALTMREAARIGSFMRASWNVSVACFEQYVLLWYEQVINCNDIVLQ
jgi:hypothetical protein